MLSELSIENFAIIDRLTVQFAPGFTVLTGETGAGKSIILDAVMLLLGGRADTAMIRAGRDVAIVSGLFFLEQRLQDNLIPLLNEQGLEGDDPDMLLIGRELRGSGRNICRINGRVVPLSQLREIGERLIDIHGQGEHLSLLKPRAHLPLLDAYANLEAERAVVSGEVGRWRAIQRELTDLQRSERENARRLDLLNFQIQEINATNLVVGEEEELRQERVRLANAEQLSRQAALVLALLEGVDDETPAVSDLMGQAERALLQFTRVDSSKSSWLERLQGLLSECSDLATEIRDYQEELEFNPGRLNFIEERLEKINQLKRKYGEDIATILAYRDRAMAELDKITHSSERIEALQAQSDLHLHTIGRLAEALSQKRQVAAGRLSAAVEQELSDLSMAGARFAVDFRRVPAGDGAYVGQGRFAFDHTGLDQAEFLLSANPGEPLKPMAKVASGGETARLMLALKTALAQVDTTPTLIFDEIDQGIGGRVGAVVGRKLWELTAYGRHQVVVVTHLPQLATFGDSHYHVRKQVAEGRTKTAITKLEGSGRVSELAAMLGTTGEHAQGGAAALLRQAAQLKEANSLPI